uniref:Lysophosphatidylcholine acyltransferase 4 n=1 Tax=Scleropages formosus TaxID=113540 RepID=A0A8C9T5T3_SCLFO
MGRNNNEARAAGAANPFVHELRLSAWRKLQVLLMGLVLFPVRVALAALLFLLMWPVAKLRLAGLSAEERAQPVRGWRSWVLHPMMLLLSRAVFFSLGFFWVKVKGRQAAPKEAPLLAVAPHSSFLDMLILCVAGLPTVVSRSENTTLPVIGALLEFNQSLLVSRKDPESRRRCAAQLSERLQSNGRWPQMLLFPEGTTTNGQNKHPVLLQDTVRGTPPPALWYTTSQLYTNITVEFLPVYSPSEEEKRDPTLYADNVQKLMAQKLGVPATDYVMEGKLPVWKLGCLCLPLEPPARKALTILQCTGMSDIKTLVQKMMDACQPGQETCIGAQELSSMLQLKVAAAVELCGLYSKDEQVDLRQLALSVAAVSGVWNLDSLIHLSFSLFDGDGKGSLTEKEMSDLFSALLGFSQRHVAALYLEVAGAGPPTQGEHSNPGFYSPPPLTTKYFFPIRNKCRVSAASNL